MWDELLKDDVMRDILSALYFLREATPFELGKVTEHSPATITRRLNELVKAGLIPEPIEDTSTGRLRRFYKAPSTEFYKYFTHFLLEMFRGRENELHHFMIDQLLKIFNIPLKYERDLIDVLESAKNPTVILLGYLLGYWDLIEDEDGKEKIVVTNAAIETLKNLYKTLIAQYIEALILIDENEAKEFIHSILKTKFGIEISKQELTSKKITNE